MTFIIGIIPSPLLQKSLYNNLIARPLASSLLCKLMIIGQNIPHSLTINCLMSLGMTQFQYFCFFIYIFRWKKGGSILYNFGDTTNHLKKKHESEQKKCSLFTCFTPRNCNLIQIRFISFHV